MFYSSLTALIIHPFHISFLFLHKTLMARNGLLCADVPLRNYSINVCSSICVIKCKFLIVFVYDVA